MRNDHPFFCYHCQGHRYYMRFPHESSVEATRERLQHGQWRWQLVKCCCPTSRPAMKTFSRCFSWTHMRKAHVVSIPLPMVTKKWVVVPHPIAHREIATVTCASPFDTNKSKKNRSKRWWSLVFSPELALLPNWYGPSRSMFGVASALEYTLVTVCGLQLSVTA